METIYRGYEIVQPRIFKRAMHTIGNGITTITVREHNATTERPITLKAFQIKRYDVNGLESAMEKARNFIDDLHLIGKVVEIKAGKYKGLQGSIDATQRRKIKGKQILFITVNLPGEENPPFETFNENELIFL